MYPIIFQTRIWRSGHQGVAGGDGEKVSQLLGIYSGIVVSGSVRRRWRESKSVIGNI